MPHGIICHSDGYLGCAYVENEIPFFLSPLYITSLGVILYMSLVTPDPYVCILLQSYH